MSELYLWYLGGPAPRLVGTLNQALGGGVSLKYAPAWLESGFALSADLPLRDTVFSPPAWQNENSPWAPGAVDDARPDRWGTKAIRALETPDPSTLELFYYTGADRFGALGVSTSALEYLPRPCGLLPTLAQAQALSDVSAAIEAGEQGFPGDETEHIAGWFSSMGGAKPKALIEIDGESWIIKFYNGEPVDTPLVEHATMTLAAKAGILVAEMRCVPLVGAHALLVRRFDRDGGRRLHCVSAGTAIRAAGGELGYPGLARVLRAGGAEQDAEELFRRMVFNILIDNTDDHEKNHALIVREPGSMRVQLAPAYDVLPSNSGQGMQEFICGARGQESSLDNAMSQCAEFGLTTAEAAVQVARVIGVVDSWREHFAGLGVAGQDLDSLAEYIDSDALLQQRREFDPAQR